MTVADTSGWTRSGIFTVLLCGFVGGIDSFDTQMIGFTGRLLAQDFGFPVADLGWLFAAGQLGAVIGAFAFGSLADRFGITRMLILCCCLAGGFTAVSLTTDSFTTLVGYRVLTGIGLGGAMPCFLGLGVEAMPARLRPALTPVLFGSFAAGGVVGAWISAPLVATYGWRGVFTLGAGLLGLASVLLVALPTVSRSFVAGETRSTVSGLVTQGRFRITLPLWALCLLAPPGIFLLATWMPPLLQLLGVSAAQTSVLVGFLNIGALVMSLAVGWLLTRLGRIGLLVPVLLLGAATFSAIAAAHREFLLLVLATTLGGGMLGGAMALIVSMAATVYPPALRATGLGWAIGFARLGQMIAPLPIGALVRSGGAPELVLAACGLPVLLALAPLLLLDKAIRRGVGSADPIST